MTDPINAMTAALADRFRIDGELGAGGMATVYRATDLKHRRPVAVKVLRPELTIAIGRDRFLREIELAAGLQHPHILGLIDSGEAEGLLYYIMPFVEGDSLRQQLRRTGAMPAVAALRLGRQIAEALDYAHRQGVIHRDIKPENILLQDGQAAVADFGIALAMRDTGDDRLTQTGYSLGTPTYMSPEQITGVREIDGRSDQYSLACVLYEMLTGAPPFAGPTAQAVMVKHVTEVVPALPATVPAAAAAAIGRALAKDPVDRFETVALFAAAFGDDGVSGAESLGRLSEPPGATIVVLPFEDASTKPEDGFFATGLTDEVISDLSKVKAIRVISRNSSMKLKGTTKDLKTIGRELAVRYVLTGSVRRAGDALRITAELVDTQTDTPVWSEKYSGTVADVFDLQEQLSRRIVDALRVTVTPEESRRLAIRAVDNIELHKVLVKARDAVFSYDPAAADRAVVELHETLASTGDNGALLGWLAMLYVHRVNIGTAPRESSIRKAEQIAGRAMRLAPDLAVPYQAMDYVEFIRVGNLGALPWARRALERERSADSLHMVAYGLAETGADPVRAVELVEEAVARDPLTPAIRVYQANVLLCAGLPGRAANSFRDAIATGFPLVGLAAIGLAYSTSQEEALTAIDACRPMGTVYDEFAPAWARALRGERPVLSERFTDAAAQGPPVVAVWVGGLFALLGDRDQALHWMRIGIERGYTHERWYTELDPFLTRYRDDPDYLALIARAKELRDSLSI
ncbi:MAG: protein kinase domain-containing protein [Gemmatimonadales bacterium]